MWRPARRSPCPGLRALRLPATVHLALFRPSCLRVLSSLKLQRARAAGPCHSLLETRLLTTVIVEPRALQCSLSPGPCQGNYVSYKIFKLSSGFLPVSAGAQPPAGGYGGRTAPAAGGGYGQSGAQPASQQVPALLILLYLGAKHHSNELGRIRWAESDGQEEPCGVDTSPPSPSPSAAVHLSRAAPRVSGVIY